MAVLHDKMILELIKAFGDALELHLEAEVWGEADGERGRMGCTAALQDAWDAQQHAFDIAERYGWNWDDDMDFSDWCLKATEPEISAEGLRIALAKCNIHEPIPACGEFIP